MEKHSFPCNPILWSNQHSRLNWWNLDFNCPKAIDIQVNVQLTRLNIGLSNEIQTNASHQKDSLLEAEPRAVNPAGVNIGCSFVTNPKFKSSNYHSQLECMHFHYWSYNVLLTRGCILKSWSTRRWTAPCIRTSNALNSCEIEEYMLHEWSLFYSVSWLKRRIRLLWWSLDFNYSEVIDIRSK